MRKILSVLACSLALSQPMTAQTVISIDTRGSVADVSPTMYGVFFEDINYGADGGLYAELVENRSFEFPDALMGWNAYGNVALRTDQPAFNRNPHYVTLTDPGHHERRTGLSNSGLFGMGLRQGMDYEFSVYARPEADRAQIRVELVDCHNNTVAKQTIDITQAGWNKYTATLTSPVTDGHGSMRLFLEGKDGVSLDHLSLMPADNWHHLRADLVEALADLHPGVLRFPGGCIVEGIDLRTRYQWKNTVGEVENRPLNENRWNYTFAHRMSPNYYQSCGLGFYEFFLLAEHIGAAPLPILNCGLACQYQNADEGTIGHVPLDSLQPYIDDALDLIEFANGDVSTHWGSLRAQMGHPAPFGLKYIGIGNEQWGKLYAERLPHFTKAIRARYPDIQIVGSAGPSPDGSRFDEGWAAMRECKADLVDEHYYMSPEWFKANATRYDSYPRRGPKVFAGEYAAHAESKDNNFESALAEAAFMTGLERNADVVRMATYAPLLAHVDGWQWKPDLIWFDNLTSVRTPNWYVQQLFSMYKGTRVVNAVGADRRPLTGQDGLYASAVTDGDSCYVKLVNTQDSAQQVVLDLKAKKPYTTATATILQTDSPSATNTLDHPDRVVPQPYAVSLADKTVSVILPARSFVLVRLSK